MYVACEIWMDHSLPFPKKACACVCCPYKPYKCVRATITSTAWLPAAEAFPPELLAAGSLHSSCAQKLCWSVAEQPQCCCPR